ncbi:uncharacterized protein LOC141605071 isoform X2 [Silene latifolia]|uniref:uncharacterized protein LOC141605071 isoform X2 n=1 Tax=Silene latifolia TaxID=37657 RepID=UPI003D776FFB
MGLQFVRLGQISVTDIPQRIALCHEALRCTVVFQVEDFHCHRLSIQNPLKHGSKRARPKYNPMTPTTMATAPISALIIGAINRILCLLRFSMQLGISNSFVSFVFNVRYHTVRHSVHSAAAQRCAMTIVSATNQQTSSGWVLPVAVFRT